MTAGAQTSGDKVKPTLSATTQQSGVSDARFARLRRGINTSHWFAQVYGAARYSSEHFRTHTTEPDIRLIESLGFDHIRFSVNHAPVMQGGDGANIPAAYLRDLDSALDMILRHDLAVIVDVHPEEDFKRNIQRDATHLAKFTRFWGSLAEHLAQRDPEKVFLEILNEPMVEDGAVWARMQAQLAAEIRRRAPRHTIIATGHKWSGLEQLIALEPLPDPNIIYNFHFYDSHNFTHQGATWGAKYWTSLKGVPYPSSPEAVAKLLPLTTNEEARGALAEYGRERWNAAHIEAEIAKAAAWGRKHGVRLTCNEFGVYRKFAVPADRAAWIRDVRVSLEKHDIGWAMWDYRGDFGVVNRAGTSVTPDAGTVAALGLTARKEASVNAR